MPVYSYLGTTTFEVFIEYDQSYENTSGVLAEYGEAIAIVGLAVSIAGGFVADKIIAGIGILVSGAGVDSVFQDDKIPSADGRLTKYTIVSHYYYKDPMTNEMVCVTGQEVYYYNASTNSLFDGNRKRQIYRPRGVDRDEKM